MVLVYRKKLPHSGSPYTVALVLFHERLNDHSFGVPCSGQGARLGMTQFGNLSADLNAAARSIGQINGVGRNLCGQP